jgi:hypothetical protein
VGGLEEPGLRPVRIGEGAALEAEQLGLDERFGDGPSLPI